nr:hypothetical protein [Candidatus Brocadiales bacterium]
VEITKHGTNQRLVRNILVSNEYLSFISMSISWGIPGELLLSLGFHVIEVGTGKAIVRHDILRKHRFFLENSDPIAQLALKLRPDLGDDRKNQISEVISEVISWLESKFRHAEFHYDKESQNIEIIGTSVENQVIEKGLRDYNLLFPDPIKIPARYNIEASRLERVVIPAEINSNINAHIKNEFEFHSPGVLVFIPGSTRVIKLTKDEKYSSQSWRNSIGISAYDL